LKGNVEAVKYAIALAMHFRLPGFAKPSKQQFFIEDPPPWRLRDKHLVFFKSLRDFVPPSAERPARLRPGIITDDIIAVIKAWDSYAATKSLRKAADYRAECRAASKGLVHMTEEQTKQKKKAWMLTQKREYGVGFMGEAQAYSQQGAFDQQLSEVNTPNSKDNSRTTSHNFHDDEEHSDVNQEVIRRLNRLTGMQKTTSSCEETTSPGVLGEMPQTEGASIGQLSSNVSNQSAPFQEISERSNCSVEQRLERVSKMEQQSQPVHRTTTPAEPQEGPAHNGIMSLVGDLYAEVTVLHNIAPSNQHFGQVFMLVEELEDCQDRESILTLTEQISAAIKKILAIKTREQRFGKVFNILEELQKYCG
jgi:hypothetical protein